jgi:hypothetical protein
MVLTSGVGARRMTAEGAEIAEISRRDPQRCREISKSPPLRDLCVNTSAFSARSAVVPIAIALLVFDSLALAQGRPAETPRAWKQPMTAWGEPDLRGTWPLNHLISTPFQRPEKYGERRFLTDEEFAAAQKSADDRNKRFLSGAIPQADAGQATRQTSLMIDPPNGRFPELTARGKALYDQMRGSYKPGQTVFDTPEDFDSWDRCITRGLPVSMLPRNYNNGRGSRDPDDREVVGGVSDEAR